MEDKRLEQVKLRFRFTKRSHGGEDFDPFANRDVPHPTNNCETLMHLIKAVVGTGILGMPIAFLNSGLFMGVICTIITGFICTHCCYVLIKCAHVLYHKNQATEMTFGEIAESTFQNGPSWCQKHARIAKQSTHVVLFLTYFGICTVYIVIVARNFQQCLEHWTGGVYNLRVLIACILFPMILLCAIPNLKFLAPVSTIANIFMFLTIGFTFYYLVQDIPPIETTEYFHFYTLPAFFGITIFALEAIGVIVPLTNNMKYPPDFLGICGVLSQGMICITLLYMVVGFMGYLRYGEETEQSITLNLPVNEWPAQAVKLFIAIAIFLSFPLSFYVAVDLCWHGIKHRYTERPLMALLMLRSFLVFCCVSTAVAVPSIAPLMSLVGAFCFSILGLIFPPIIEIILLWESGFGTCNWILWKNIFCIFFGTCALIFGTVDAIKDISKLYTEIN